MPLRQPTDREDRPRPGAQHQPAPSFGRLARQIAVWTTRALACALVLLLAVGFGVQTLRWWSTQPAEIITHRAALDEPLGDPTQWHVLQFASQPWQIHRRTLYGDKTAAIDALRQRCRAALEQHPTDGVPATEVELQLLQQVAGSKPIEEQPGRWKLYCNDQTLPMLVGVSDSSAEAGTAESCLADDRPRVLIWALAAQQAANTWSLYVFQPEQQQQTALADTAGQARVELPPSARRTLEMTVAPGGRVVVFQTSGSLVDCQRFYDAWFAQHRWTAVTDWKEYGAKARCARFRHRNQDLSADVHLSDMYSNGLGQQTSGLVLLWQGGY